MNRILSSVCTYNTLQTSLYTYRRLCSYGSPQSFSSPVWVRWAIAITWRPSSSSVVRPSSVVRRKPFQKSFPLKVLDQWKPNLIWIITRVSSFKIVSGDAVHQPTWPLLLKIEQMVKLQVLGNNSKTVNNIKNRTWGKMISTSRSTYPAILK